MDKKIVMIFVIALVSFLLSQDIEKKIIEKYSNSIYTIRYVKKTPSFMGRGEEKESTKYALGIAVKEDLILMSSVNFKGGLNSAFSIGWNAQATAGGSTQKKPDFVYIVVDEKTEIKAKFIGENTDLNVLYYKPVEQDKKLNFIDVNKYKETKLSVGETVYIIDRFLLIKELNFPIQVKSKKIEIAIEKPYPEYTAEGVMGGFNIQPLALTFNSKGELFGVISLTQNIKKGEAPQDVTSFDIGNMVGTMLAENFLVIKPLTFLQKALTQIPTEIKKGWIGFFGDSLEFITKEEAEEFLKLKEEQKGLRIASLSEQTPVSKSGLKVGDIVLKIGDVDCVVKEPKEVPSLFEKLSKSLEVGKIIKIKYLRKNEQGTYEEREADVKIEERPLEFENAEEYEEKKLGFRVKPLTFDYKYKNKLSATQTGLVITFVKGGEPAAVGGIIGGDILISLSVPSANKEIEIDSIEKLKKFIDELSQTKPKEIIAKILSRKETKFITLRNINW